MDLIPFMYWLLPNLYLYFFPLHVHLFDYLFDNQEVMRILIFNVSKMYFWSFSKICLSHNYLSKLHLYFSSFSEQKC